jgi:hypothetical protein
MLVLSTTLQPPITSSSPSPCCASSCTGRRGATTSMSARQRMVPGKTTSMSGVPRSSGPPSGGTSPSSEMDWSCRPPSERDSSGSGESPVRPPQPVWAVASRAKVRQASEARAEEGDDVVRSGRIESQSGYQARAGRGHFRRSH